MRRKGNFAKDNKMRKLFGVLCLLGACCLAYYIVSRELDTFALIKNGQTAPGFIIKTWREVTEADEQTNRIVSDQFAKYTYRIPDGRRFTKNVIISNKLGRTIAEEGVWPYPIDVKYLPEKPNVSFIKSEGKGIFGWAVDLGIGLIIPSLLGVLGIVYLFKRRENKRPKAEQDNK